MEIKMKYQEIFDICEKKINLHLEKTTPEVNELRECEDGRYYNHELGAPLSYMYNWMSSFVTGLAPLVYEYTGDKSYLERAAVYAKAYEDKINAEYTQTMHDIGFLYIPYSVKMYEATGEVHYKKAALRAADELAKRFDINGRFIEAWSEMNNENPERRIIIDTMMNIPLLLWAWKQTGHLFYFNIAAAHAETTKRVLIRDDYSVAHSFVFNADGTVKAEANDCGYANGSHWARGTAWAVFGYAIFAEYTGSNEYLELAEKIAEKYLSELKNGEMVPVWDFRLPHGKPAKAVNYIKADWDETNPENMIYNKDSSAAAIMACAFMTLFKISKNEKYSVLAKKSLNELCERYFNDDPETEGMLMHSNGANCYTMYGDYYFMVLLSMFLDKDKA